MISRRQIIESQRGQEAQLEPAEERGAQVKPAGGGRQQQQVASSQTDASERQAGSGDNNNLAAGRARKKASGAGQLTRRAEQCALNSSKSSSGGAGQPSSAASARQARPGFHFGRAEERGRAQQEEELEEAQEEAQASHFDPYSVYGEEDEEEDVWYSEERLFEDHIQEIVDKWFAIDDEIWAKIICMERNRRIAKAYARKHTLTINGSKDEYLDGTTLGLNLFDNPDRDTKTRHVKQYIGQGLRIKITQSGDILVKRLSKANIFVHKLNQHQAPYSLAQADCSKGSSSDLYALNSESGELYGIVAPMRQPHFPYGRASNSSSALSMLERAANGTNKQLLQGAYEREQQSELAPPTSSSEASSSSSTGGLNMTVASSINSKQPNSTNSVSLDHNRAHKIFDMSKFKANLERESRLPCPNRRVLQNQCISIVSFVVDDHKLLNLPSWIMIVNIVAIDLLKIELGLSDAQDFFSAPSLLSDPLADRHRFGAQNSRHMRHHYAPDESTDGRLTAASPMNMMLMMQSRGEPARRQSNQNHLAASKQAFANAAARGAYNGDHHANPRAQLITSGQLRLYQQQELLGESELCDAQNDVSDEELKLSAETAKGQNSAARKRADCDVQQSSASSGFNSHCSSQNDSSAASSSSNIAASGMASGVEDNLSVRGAISIPAPPNVASIAAKINLSNSGTKVKEERHPDEELPCENKNDESSASKGAFKYKHQNRANSNENYPQRCDHTNLEEPTRSRQALVSVARGKRPPKLPHRLSNGLVRPSKLTEPIPIPAPPTSAGSGPSGKANLILVSPTGLSPPLPKRMGIGSPNSKLSKSRSQSELSSQDLNTPTLAGDERLPQFSCIKHIDENGRCSVLKIDSTELPAGIPAHAQLAPPATQRHILRYLMSAARGEKLRPSNQQASQVMQPNTHRVQRPLPILPNQKLAPRTFVCCSDANYSNRFERQQQEENLYYCGLQARVPLSNRALAQHQVNKNAINVLLTDYRQSSHARSECIEPYHSKSNSGAQVRHQYSFSNLLEPRQVYRYNQQQYCLNNSNLMCALHSKQASASSSVTRPLLKFFKSNSSNKTSTTTNGCSSISPSVNPPQIGSSGRFSSVDNLHQTSQKSSPSSILNHMGIPLKLKSKVKKPSPNEN